MNKDLFEIVKERLDARPDRKGLRCATRHACIDGSVKLLTGYIDKTWSNAPGTRPQPNCVHIIFDDRNETPTWRFADDVEYLGDQDGPKYPAINPREEPRVATANDGSNWRDWAERRPGVCPCGIERSTCEYHR